MMSLLSLEKHAMEMDVMVSQHFVMKSLSGLSLVLDWQGLSLTGFLKDFERILKRFSKDVVKILKFEKALEGIL